MPILWVLLKYVVPPVLTGAGGLWLGAARTAWVVQSEHDRATARQRVVSEAQKVEVDKRVTVMAKRFRAEILTAQPFQPSEPCPACLSTDIHFAAMNKCTQSAQSVQSSRNAGRDGMEIYTATRALPPHIVVTCRSCHHTWRRKHAVPPGTAVPPSAAVPRAIRIDDRTFTN